MRRLLGCCLIAAAGSATSISAQAGQADWPALVTYSSPTTIPLDPKPSLAIAESADCQFNRIRTIVLQTNDRLVVANAGNTELCIFGPKGEFIRRVGRRGAGPGEYQSIFGLYRLFRDSLLVYDAGLRRVSILDAEGKFVRSIPLTPPTDTLGSVWVVAALEDGTFVVGYSEFITGAPRPEPVTFTQHVFRYDSKGILLGSIGRFPASEHFIQAVPPSMGGVAYWDRAFGRRWSLAPIPGGFVAGDGADFSVGQYANNGARAVLHRIDRQSRRVTAQHLAMYRERSLKSVRPENQAVEDRRLAEMPYPSFFPAFRRLVTDPLGRIWLELYPAPGDEGGQWLALDRRTRRASLIGFPPGFQLHAVGATMICGVARDQDELESIRCFLLRNQ